MQAENHCQKYIRGDYLRIQPNILHSIITGKKEEVVIGVATKIIKPKNTCEAGFAKG